jgi:hypothetical protein
MNCCEKCKFSDLDYIFDDETGEEYPIYPCKKGHNKLLNFDYVADRRKVLTEQEECLDFKEYKPKKYKEKDTKCDKCKNFSKCKNEGILIKCTTSYDINEHYIVGWWGSCLCKE